jgi:hypothetical protein
MSLVFLLLLVVLVVVVGIRDSHLLEQSLPVHQNTINQELISSSFSLEDPQYIASSNQILLYSDAPHDCDKRWCRSVRERRVAAAGNTNPW